MNSKKTYIILLLLLIVVSLHSQTINVSGSLIDIEDQSALIGANVILNGNQQYATISEQSGRFIFKGVKPGLYLLQVSYVGYEPYISEKVQIKETYDFGLIKMKTKNTSLDEVVVEGKIPLAITKGDTVEYNADAYKTNPDADAEDLIKKMPGVVVDEGKVQAQGEDVKKVYVDGKPFFDQDPTLALRSLPAEVIQKIEVFDEQSEQAKFTGFDDGETIKVMNIVTRSNMKTGQFGKLYIGGGLPDKYNVGGNVNLFDKDRRISIIGMSNNVNQQNFSNEDLLGVVGNTGRSGGGFRGRPSGGGGRPSGGGMRSGGGISNQDFMVGQQNGISKTTAFGLNYSDKWGDKINVAGSYFFNLSDNNSEQDILQQYFTDSDFTSQSYQESNNSSSTNYNHRFHFKLDYDINENNKLIIQPRISLQTNESENYINAYSWLNDTLLNQNKSSYNNSMSGLNISSQIVYMHKFAKTGRTISLNLNTSMGPRNSDNYQKSYQLNTEENLATDSLNLFNDYLSNNNGISGRLVYTEPIGENSQLMFNVNSSVSFEKSDREAYNFDFVNNSYNQLDTALSNIYSSSYYTQQFGGGYKYRKGKNFFMFGLNYEHAELKSEQLFPEESFMNNTYNSFLPMAVFRYSISRSKNLSVFYRSNSKSPTIEQLQNTIDNSNPLQLEVGNPELNPAFEQSLFLRYNVTNTEKATVFFIMGRIRHSNNYIGNSTWFAQTDTMINNSVLLQQGGQISQPINLDNYWDVRLFSTYGLPIKKLKSNFNINLSYNYTYTPGIIDDLLTYSKNNIFGTGLVLSSNISERIDFTISSNTKYNKANSSLQNQLSNTFLNQKTEIDLSLLLWKGITFRTSAANQYYFYPDQDYDESIFLVNMEVGKKLFKNQRGELKVSVFDLLNQNNSISRNVTDLYVEDVRTNALQRFFMLTFNYQIRNFGE